MSCNLTKGRNISCRDSVGGIKAVYFAQFDDVVSYVSASGELTDFIMGAADDIYKYSLKRGTGSVTETITGSSENGTVFYTPTINIKLHKLTKEDQNQIKLLTAQRLVVFVELNELFPSTTNNLLLCLGLENGLELNAGTNTSGVAFGDMAGYDWTLDGMERDPMVTVANYTTTPLDNATFTFNAVVTS